MASDAETRLAFGVRYWNSKRTNMSGRPPKLILASRSPRRRELLAEAGYVFDVLPASDDLESQVPSQGTPAEVAARLAEAKAADVARRVPSGIVVGCDTVVELAGQLVGKPLDQAHARQILRMLRGQRHLVHTGVCVWPVPSGSPQVRVATTVVRMDWLTDEQIEEYLASGAWEGKAGAFGYQDRLGWVHIVEGSPTNVVGLPMELLEEMLRQAVPPASQ